MPLFVWRVLRLCFGVFRLHTAYEERGSPWFGSLDTIGNWSLYVDKERNGVSAVESGSQARGCLCARQSHALCARLSPADATRMAAHALGLGDRYPFQRAGVLEATAGLIVVVGLARTRHDNLPLTIFGSRCSRGRYVVGCLIRSTLLRHACGIWLFGKLGLLRVRRAIRRVGSPWGYRGSGGAIFSSPACLATPPSLRS